MFGTMTFRSSVEFSRGSCMFVFVKPSEFMETQYLIHHCRDSNGVVNDTHA